jgi:hypothetical protein
MRRSSSEVRASVVASASPRPVSHRRGRTSPRARPSAHAGPARHRAAHQSRRLERSPRARFASNAASGCRTSCRTRLQSFAHAAVRSARPTLRREAIAVPRRLRSPRRNARFRSPFGNVSSGSLGNDRMDPRPRTQFRHTSSFRGRPSFLVSLCRPHTPIRRLQSKDRRTGRGAPNFLVSDCDLRGVLALVECSVGSDGLHARQAHDR